MGRVLMLSYYFPPLGGIGSIRALKLATYLPEFGWDPTVVAPRDGAYYRDPSLRVEKTKTIRTRSFEISRAGKRMIGVGREDTKTAEMGRTLSQVQKFARRWIYRPDAQIGWYPFAVLRGRQVMRHGEFDAIFSSSFPVTAHLVGRRLHDEFGIPWIAEFRDLWTDLTAYDSQKREQRDQATERALLDAATHVVTVSESYADTFLERGAHKVSVITNGFDSADFGDTLVTRRPVVTYLGSYYADRQDLRTVLRALSELVKAGPLSGLTVRFVGAFPEDLRGFVREVGLSDSIECTGFVPHQDALRYISNSTLLLLAGPAHGIFKRSRLKGNIASKVFEYLGSRRPILCVCEAESEIETVIRRFPGVACVRPGDLSGTRGAILSLIRQGPTGDRQGLEVYTWQSLAGQLAKVLDDS